METISVNKARMLVLLAVIVSILSLSNSFSARAEGVGLLVLETYKPDIYSGEEITVNCFHFDNMKNIRKNDPWNVTVPNGRKLEVRLMAHDRNLEIIEPSIRIPITNLGPVASWHIVPHLEGRYKLILEYFIDGKSYSKPSDYIKM